MKIKPLFVLVVLLFSFLNNSNSQTLKDDSLALVNFYNSTGGPNWTKKTNWLSGRVNTWHGIIVSSGRVAQINLPNNNLSGRIDSQFNLSALNTLTINNNSITELNLSNLPAINKIQANYNIINNVFFNANSNYYNNLSEVYLAYNSFSSIDISKLSSLTLFTEAYNRNLTTVITNATPGYYYRINSFSTGITSVSSLNLQGMRSATMLFVQDSKLESLDLSGFDK